MELRKNVTEVGFDRYATEASALEIAPGRPMPTTIDADGMGNGQPFVLERVDAMGAGVYRQGNGSLALVVFND